MYLYVILFSIVGTPNHLCPRDDMLLYMLVPNSQSYCWNFTILVSQLITCLVVCLNPCVSLVEVSSLHFLIWIISNCVMSLSMLTWWPGPIIPINLIVTWLHQWIFLCRRHGNDLTRPALHMIRWSSTKFLKSLLLFKKLELFDCICVSFHF